MDAWTIDYPLACRGPGTGSRVCGYDLRTIRATAVCPECGWAVSKTLVAAYDDAQGDGLTWAGRSMVHPGVRKLAARSVYSVETLELLLGARRFVFEAGRGPHATPVAPGSESVSAAQQCRGLRDHFRLSFGDAAVRELMDRGLSDRESVGGVVQQLAAFGAIRLGADETIAAYRAADCPDPVPPAPPESAGDAAAWGE